MSGHDAGSHDRGGDGGGGGGGSGGSGDGHNCCTTGICGLLNRYQCNIPRVFAAIAFQPPPPSYTIVDGRMRIQLDPRMDGMVALREVAPSVECVGMPNGRTKRGTTDVFVLRQPGG